jgi:hypothetical protein
MFNTEFIERVKNICTVMQCHFDGVTKAARVCDKNKLLKNSKKKTNTEQEISAGATERNKH